MIVFLLAAVFWTAVHNAPDNAPTYVDHSGRLEARR